MIRCIQLAKSSKVKQFDFDLLPIIADKSKIIALRFSGFKFGFSVELSRFKILDFVP